MPVVIEPIKITRQYSLRFHFGHYIPGNAFGGKEPAKEGAAIARWIGYGPERNLRQLRNDALQQFMVAALHLQELVHLTDLCKPNGRVQFGNAVVVADEGMKIGSAINSSMVMPMIGIAIAFDVRIFIV